MQLLITKCSHCSGEIEYDKDFEGLPFDCPHCQRKTVLGTPAPIVPPPPKLPAAPPPPPPSNLIDCPDCRRQISMRAASCPHCGAPIAPPQPAPGPAYVIPAKSRGIYIILGLFLGFLGIHNFYAGRHGAAVGQLLVTVLIGWFILPLLVVFAWVLIDLFTVTTDGQGRALA